LISLPISLSALFPPCSLFHPEDGGSGFLRNVGETFQDAILFVVIAVRTSNLALREVFSDVD
jgi:hypothetical protein